MVGLVQHDYLGHVEAHRPGGEMVEQPARRRHQHVDAARHGADLRGVADTADDHGHRQPQVTAIGAEAVGDLRRQLARRRQDQRPAVPSRRRPAVGGEAMQDRQGEGRGLAGAGLGDAQQVAALQQVRDGLGLDGGGGVIALFGEGTKQRLGEAEIGKERQVEILS